MRSLFVAGLFGLTMLFTGCADSTETTVTDVTAAGPPVNPVCPIMGGDVTEEGGTVTWNDQTIGFCCDGCSEKWMALSEDEKASRLAEVTAAETPAASPEPAAEADVPQSAS